MQFMMIGGMDSKVSRSFNVPVLFFTVFERLPCTFSKAYLVGGNLSLQPFNKYIFLSFLTLEPKRHEFVLVSVCFDYCWPCIAKTFGVIYPLSV